MMIINKNPWPRSPNIRSQVSLALKLARSLSVPSEMTTARLMYTMGSNAIHNPNALSMRVPCTSVWGRILSDATKFVGSQSALKPSAATSGATRVTHASNAAAGGLRNQKPMGKLMLNESTCNNRYSIPYVRAAPNLAVATLSMAPCSTRRRNSLSGASTPNGGMSEGPSSSSEGKRTRPKRMATTSAPAWVVATRGHNKGECWKQPARSPMSSNHWHCPSFHWIYRSSARASDAGPSHKQRLSSLQQIVGSSPSSHVGGRKYLRASSEQTSWVTLGQLLVTNGQSGYIATCPEPSSCMAQKGATQDTVNTAIEAAANTPLRCKVMRPMGRSKSTCVVSQHTCAREAQGL
mmetsp:Transcript_107205/g.300145  ORF Transcript_107205/g.300145 Transcript_107205/m.300145 type:complete len:350 (+) Transcript_107205:1183-2232(+)